MAILGITKLGKLFFDKLMIKHHIIQFDKPKYNWN